MTHNVKSIADDIGDDLAGFTLTGEHCRGRHPDIAFDDNVGGAKSRMVENKHRFEYAGQLCPYRFIRLALKAERVGSDLRHAGHFELCFCQIALLSIG